MTQQRAIRICRVIARMNGGGPAVHLLHLARGLDPQRFTQLTVSGRVGVGEVDMADEARELGLDVRTLPSLGRDLHPIADTITILRLVRLFREWRPDIVETHTAKAGTVGRIAATLAGVPIRIHVFHGHVFHGYFSPARTRLFLEVERALAHVTTKIIALGGRQRQDILSYGVGQPSSVLSIPLGFDLSEFGDLEKKRGALRRELGIGQRSRTTSPIIGIVGRLVAIKAHEVFLDAATQILAQIPDAHFVIAGDGERRTALERSAVGSPLEGHLHFLGWRRDTATIYADLDLLLLTSNNEGMPVAIIEALASGVPVVATDVGGVPDLIRDGVNGRLVPPRDPRATAQASVELLTNSDTWTAMSRAGRESVIPEHELSTLIERMTALYKSLMRQ